MSAENEFIQGDALDVLPTLPEGKFDLLITDPPYAYPATYYPCKTGKRRWSDTSILSGWWTAMLDRIIPLMKENGQVLVFVNAKSIPVFFPRVYEVTKNATVLVWQKEVGGGRGFPVMNQCEFVIFGALEKAWRSEPIGQHMRFRPVPVAQRLHPAQKPSDLIEKLIRTFCPPGGCVLDPFAGSNVVGLVAEGMGMSSVTIDLDPTDHQTAAEGAPLLRGA